MAKTPRNLRQVGNPRENLSIYIEDYVFTYLKSEYNTEAAILIGESCYEENGISVYIRGAIACPQIFWREEGMEMTGRTWNYIFRERERMYSGQEIVGWYLPIPPENEERTLIALGEFHGRNFPGADKVFFYLNREKGDEAFFVRDGQIFKKQPGYYIFYEKNTVMREYMLSLREERQLEADLYKEVHEQPRETFRYREYINAELNKKERESGGISYAVSILSVVAVFALVIGILSGYSGRSGWGDFFQTIGNVLRISEKEASQLGDDVENIVSQSTSGEVSQDASNNQSSSEETSKTGEENADADDSGESDTESGNLSESDPSIGGTQFDTEVDEDETAIAMALAQGYYVVQKGESLMSICRKLYGNEEQFSAICEKNAITDPNSIYPGQIIYLP